MTDDRTGRQLACGRRETDGSIVIDVRVQSRSSRIEVLTVENGRLKLRLTAPPVDGKANRQAAGILAKAFGVAPSRVELVRGRASRDKSFRISAATRIPPFILADDQVSGSGQT